MSLSLEGLWPCTTQHANAGLIFFVGSHQASAQLCYSDYLFGKLRKVLVAVDKKVVLA